MKIITNNLDEKAPVYHKYPGQINPQPAFIELDCRGEGKLMADYSGEIGNAVPCYYWNGLAVRWGISSETSGDSLKTIFENEELLAICQRIVDGFEEKWNGSNFVGKYSDDAKEAIDEAERYIENNLECSEVWNVYDWLFNNCVLKDHWADQPIEKAAEDCVLYIDFNVEIDGDIEDVLINKACEMFDYNQDCLTETHINELLKRGKITEEEAEEWRGEYL